MCDNKKCKAHEKGKCCKAFKEGGRTCGTKPPADAPPKKPEEKKPDNKR